jgi:hypothetical protein
MNKILIGAIATMTLVPAMLFANDDPWNNFRPDIDHMKHMNYSGSTASGMVRPPVGTGAMIALELKALHEAGEKLTLEQRIELAKIIRTYISPSDKGGSTGDQGSPKADSRGNQANARKNT